MVTLEQVEKLRERADVSFEEARDALEQSGGDLLDALILLERQGKTAAPPSGGFYSGERDEDYEGDQGAPHHGHRRNGHMSPGDVLRSLGAFLLKIVDIGNANYIDASKGDKVMLSCPVTVFVILLIVAFWVTIPLLFVGLIFGWRFKMRGPNLGRDSINDVIMGAEDAVEDLKNTVVETAQNAKAEREAKKAAANETTEKI